MNNCSRTEPYVHIPDSKEPHDHVNSSPSQLVLAARLCTNVHASIKAFSVPKWSLAGASPAQQG